MLELRAGEAVLTVDPPSGGLVTAITIAGFDVLASHGLFVMAPWAGRTGHARFGGHPLPVDDPPHALHGTVRGVAWTVSAHTPTSATLDATLGPAWPWPGRCEHTIELHPDHVDLRVAVAGDGFPAVVGWHPWFTKPAAVELEAAAMLERGDDQLPTGRRVAPPRIGERPLDDCFEDVRWPAVLRYDGGRTITIHADGCPYAVVYDERPYATCVEPQSAPPNALNTGEARPAPVEAKMSIAWS